MKRRRFTPTICLFILFTLVIFLFPLAAKETPKKLNEKDFGKFITDVMNEWKVPGLAISIVRDNEVIYSRGFGFRDIKKGLKVTPNTLFAIGSCTKAFTALAMGILVDEGKLDWDKPVRNYLPEFRLKDPFASERMTPRDLVCHRSGLPRHDLVWYNSPASREELVKRLAYLEPSKDFRTTFQYQNLMFMTAGYLVSRVAGKKWEDFVRERIFSPLGMKESNFSVEDSKKAPDYALPYYKAKNGQVIEIPFRNIDNVGPAGSINSNVTDMTRWLILNLNKGKYGEKQIISKRNLREIHSPQMIASRTMRYDELFYSTYGMGWGITAYRGHLMLSHGGGIDGFTARVSLMPKDNIGLVILTNLNGTPVPQIVAYNAFDRLLGLSQIPWNRRIKEEREKAENEAEKAKKEKEKERKLNTRPSHPLEDYAGDYFHPGYGVLSIQKKGEKLIASYNDMEFPMEHYHYDIFEIRNEQWDTTYKASFFTDERGNIGSVSVELEPAVDPILFTRMPEKKRHLQS
ncbi:MAG: serine hydrolase [Candidatus Aminicenantales bacterium]